MILAVVKFTFTGEPINGGFYCKDDKVKVISYDPSTGHLFPHRACSVEMLIVLAALYGHELTL